MTTPNYDVRTVSNLVVGSGAAAYNAANRLHDLGEEVVIVTENRLAGTSRNTGSDKQTYYKLTLSGDYNDSVQQMAGTLFDGQSIDGDICLAEAANSARSFMNLVENGVPFPTDRHGSFIGYKTDHDPALRGTSVGPLTSKAMTEKLEAAAKRRGIELIDKHLVIRILSEDGKAVGVLTHSHHDDETPYHVILANNIVYATGGPAGIYKNVVFPHGHYGMSGIAYEAGARGRNLTEWQYGLASVSPRWNVSGTYMQVLPRFISTDQDGNDAREFLTEYFPTVEDELNRVFLKGYQWPFDVKKAKDGSSVIDLLVYRETQLRGRRVFMDFTQNPRQVPVAFDALGKEQLDYLQSVDACFGTPIERLRHMNEPAYEFYLSKGVDLEQKPLEIDLCAQHNNGGLAVSNWWQTDLEGFYAAGEVAGTHGVNRPGGSALNAGQVGSLRAALHIHSNSQPGTQVLSDTLRQSVEEQLAVVPNYIGTSDTCAEIREDLTRTFSEIAGPIRDVSKLQAHREKLEDLLKHFDDRVRITETRDLKKVFRLKDICIAQLQYTVAMQDFVAAGGKSRGSCIFLDPEGTTDQSDIFDGLVYTLDDGNKDALIQEVSYDGSEVHISWRERNPLPQPTEAFETVWRRFREDGNIH